MTEERFTISTPAGDIAAWRGGNGAETAVLLHGGPGMSDYLETLTPLLGDRFRTVRYQQRGVAPTTIGPPYTVEAHIDDAIAVIDQEAGGRAWVVGHSWGGHLALHMLVACPDRLAGAVIVDPLGAHMDVMEPFGDRLQAGLTDAQRERSAELDAREDAGEATSEDSREALAMVWPNYFADPATAFPMPPLEFGAAGYAGTTASVAEHAERGHAGGRPAACAGEHPRRVHPWGGQPDADAGEHRHGRADPACAGRRDRGRRPLPVAGAAPGRSCRRLTCDYLVTYYRRMDDDLVFKALADPSRRLLLDRLFERDGRTLTELESQLDMTRFGVMKHLKVLEQAGLVVPRKQGREKLHYLNPVPIRQILDRWIGKYREREVSALLDLKATLEGT